MFEATCNSRGVRALILVQSIVTNVPLELLRASRRHMRCGGGGVKKKEETRSCTAYAARPGHSPQMSMNALIA